MTDIATILGKLEQIRDDVLEARKAAKAGEVGDLLIAAGDIGSLAKDITDLVQKDPPKGEAQS